MFALFSVDGWDHNFVEDHVFFEVKLSNFGLPTDKGCEVVVVDEEVKDGFGFGEMDELRDFCSEYGLKISVIISFNRGADSPDE